MTLTNRPESRRQDTHPWTSATTTGASSCPSQLLWSEDDPEAALTLTDKSASRIWHTISQSLADSHTLKTTLLSLARVMGSAFAAEACLVAEVRHAHTVGLSVGWRAARSHLVGCDEIPLWLLQQLASSHDIPPNSAHQGEQLLTLISAAGKLCPSCQTYLSNKRLWVIKTVFKSKLNGVIVLLRSPEHPWHQSDEQLLQTLSNQLAIAISQAQLEHLMHQQIQYQGLVERVTCAIRNTWDIDSLFDLTAEGLIAALEIRRAMVLTLKYADPLQKQRLLEWVPKAKAVVECVRDTSGHSSSIYQEPAPSVTESIAAKPSFWVADCPILQSLFSEKPTSLAIANIHHVQDTTLTRAIDLSHDISPEFLPNQLPAIFLMPLEHQGTILGFLVLQHDRPRDWAPQETILVKTIADHLSAALLQARTIRHIQALVEERTAQLQHSLEVQAKLYEKTRHQVEQLRQMNRRQEEFLSTVSHELLTPLTSMTVAIRMLKQAALSAERRDKYLAILEQQCYQETSLITDLLTLQKLELGQLAFRFQPIDARYLIRDVAQSFESLWQQKQLTLSLELPESPLNICTDVDSLSRIVTELLSNAGKYTQPSTTVELGVSQVFDQRQNEIVLTLRNQGAGISPNEIPTIFDRFVRGEGVTRQAIPGTGLGLALVKGLVEHLNGAIAVWSQPLAEGQTWETCFKVTLPQSPDLSLT